MKITPSCIQDILSAAKIEEVIADFCTLNVSGKSRYTECPKCGKGGKNKGLIVTPVKGIFKCFSCEFGGKSAAEFLMETQNMTYPEALKYLADKFNITVDYEEKPRGPQKKQGAKQQSFRDMQLASSGLLNEDQKIMVRVTEENKAQYYDRIEDKQYEKLFHKKIDVPFEIPVNIFTAGTRDQYGRITQGDDMIIWYDDLEGKPVTYQKEKSSKTLNLFRIRWQNPDAHRDKHGKPIKYQSPSDSGSHLFIPEQIRDAYRTRRVIRRLFIQEGEKKAIKACKHGMPSVGIMGIQNIGYKNVLPYEFQLIVKACQVEEVIFILDSDWDHLSDTLRPGSKVDSRPYSFYRAVANFKEYFKTFINMGIYLEIYFGYLLENKQKEKGIDDLLSGSMAKDPPETLLNDINTAINEKAGTGKYIQLHKISTMSDAKLLEFWNLNNAEAFAQKYKDTLINIPEFVIGKHKWRFNDKGNLEPAQPLQEDEQYWEKQIKTDRKGNEYTQYFFRYYYAWNFLKRRGFGRIMMADGRFQLCHIIDNVVHIVESWYIRDYMMEFTKNVLATQKEDFVPVMDMLYRGGNMYYGPDKLSNIDLVGQNGFLVFEYADKNYQYLFFKDKFWKVTSEGIEEKAMSELQHYVWKENVKHASVTLITKDLIEVEKIDRDMLIKNGKDPDEFASLIGQFDVELSPEARESHFIQYLINTGEFFWVNFQDTASRKRIHDTRTMEERYETNLHLVSKMTAIGYLLHRYNDASCEKAVIGMDGRLSEVGESNGRSGKSLLGKALKNIISTVTIGAKSRDLENDQFLFEEVSEKTDIIFLDDCRANLDFEFFFPMITGQLTINRKGQIKFTLSGYTPKIYITTNHAINGSSSSFKDRQALIAFSDYYNESWKPPDEFGMNFFDDWDEKQWNLFYNFMAYCLVLYFRAQKNGWGVNRSGLIQPPTERLEKRRLRQFIGEDFLTWSGEFFNIDPDNVNAPTTTRMNEKIARSELYSSFLDKTPTQRKFVTPQRFKKKMMAWCDYMGLRFNPNAPGKDGGTLAGGDIKTGGVEYFIIANDRFTE